MLFSAAAKGGNNEAHFHLGVMYLRGEGIKKNPEAAQKHLTEAANVRLPRLRAPPTLAPSLVRCLDTLQDTVKGCSA